LPHMKLGQMGAVVGLFLMPAVMMVAMTGIGRMGAWAPVAFIGCAAFYALVRWAILPSRIPMMVRMAIMGAGLFIPGMCLVDWTTSERTVERALAQMDAKAGKVDTARWVDWIVNHGRYSCKALVPRLDGPTRRPETRVIAHEALVKLRGADLGGTRAAWEAWC